MKQTKSLLFLAFLAVGVTITPAMARVTPPDMPINKQLVHSDPFTEMMYQVCRGSHPRDVERCVRLIRLLDKIGKPQPAPSGDCSYLILENTESVFPCN